MPHIGKQAIQCSVASCRHHGTDGYCRLKSIQVAPDAAAPKVNSADQSMCASFEHDKNGWEG